MPSVACSKAYLSFVELHDTPQSTAGTDGTAGLTRLVADYEDGHT